MTANKRACQPSGEDGFTLIEILVALGVLSLSLPILWLVFSQGLERTGRDENSMAARVLAQSIMSEIETSSVQDVRARSGSKDKFQWRIALSPYGEAGEREAWDLSPVSILVDVSWTDGGHHRNISLSTIRLLPKG